VCSCRYNARPHWGKNFDRTFTHPKCPIRPKYPGFARQLAAQKRYDPAGMYQPALFAKVGWICLVEQSRRSVYSYD
jgi:hypothetical protein